MSGTVALQPLTAFGISRVQDADPFTLVERALWRILEASPSFTELVKAANRVQFANPTGPVDPVRESLTTADLPEVMILPSVDDPNTQRTSAGPSMLMTFNLLITSGDSRTHAKMNPVKWQVWRAFERLNDDLKSYLPWIIKADTGSFQNSYNEQAGPARGPRGWNTTMEIRVLAMFPKSMLEEQ